MFDLAIITSTEPPGIWSQAFFDYQLLVVWDEEIDAQGEPVSVGQAKGVRQTYEITDSIGPGGSDTFTADFGEGGILHRKRFAVVPWWHVAAAGIGLTLLGSYLWEDKNRTEVKKAVGLG